MSKENRKDIMKLSSDDVLALRTAYAGIMALPDTDKNSYNYLAAIHGGGNPLIPEEGFCVHNDKGFGFICWHRLYIQKFENALQTIVPGIKLPYWDWFTKTDSGEYVGFPQIFTEDTYVDKDGKTQSNPLKSAKGRRGDTTRKSKLIETDDDANALNASAAAEKNNWTLTVLEPKDGKWGFDERTRKNPHNSLHVLIGGDDGDMSIQEYAAFDPIFWVHHANVDRLWASWQRLHPSAKLNPTVAETELLFPNGEKYKAKDTLVAPEYDRYDGVSHLHTLAMASPSLGTETAPKKAKELKVHVHSPVSQLVHVAVKGQKIGHVAVFGSDPKKALGNLNTKEESHDHSHASHMGGHSHAANGENEVFDVSDLGDFDEKDVDIIPTSKNIPKPHFTVAINS